MSRQANFLDIKRSVFVSGYEYYGIHFGEEGLETLNKYILNYMKPIESYDVKELHLTLKDVECIMNYKEEEADNKHLRDRVCHSQYHINGTFAGFVYDWIEDVLMSNLIDRDLNTDEIIGTTVEPNYNKEV